jgi:hypothetical protein
MDPKLKAYLRRNAVSVVDLNNNKIEWVKLFVQCTVSKGMTTIVFQVPLVLYMIRVVDEGNNIETLSVSVRNTRLGSLCRAS